MAVKGDLSGNRDPESGNSNPDAGSGVNQEPETLKTPAEDTKATPSEDTKDAPESPEAEKKDDAEEVEDESMPKRDHVTWANHWVFVFSLMSFTINLHSIWTFPYLMYSNGGIAFLIPYIAVTLVVALPLQFLELFIGQVSRCFLVMYTNYVIVY